MPIDVPTWEDSEPIPTWEESSPAEDDLGLAPGAFKKYLDRGFELQTAIQPPDLTQPEIRPYEPGLATRIRTSPVGRALLGPTEAEREGMIRRGDVGVLEIPETMLGFTSIGVPPVKTAISNAQTAETALTEPIIEKLPEPLQTGARILNGIRKGVAEFVTNVPLAPIPGTTKGKALAATMAAFGADWLSNQPDVYKQYRDALDRGDLTDATAIATQNFAGGALLALGGRHAMNELRPAVAPPIQGPIATGEVLRMPKGAKPIPVPKGPTAAELMAAEAAAQPKFVKPADYVEPAGEVITPPKVETLDWWKEKLTAITQEFNKPRVSKKKKYSLIKDAEEARREISRLGGTKTDIQEATYGKPSSTPPAESAKSQISVSEPDVQSSTPVQRQDKAGGAGEKPALETAEPMAKAERDAAEAKALDEKQQLDLLNKPPKPISMGGLNPSDPMERPSSAMPTANKNANIDADRVARGEAPLVAAMRQADADLWDSAMAVINDDWMAADKLIDRFNKQPFVPTDKELVILLQRRVDLKNEFAKAARDMALAAEEGRTEAYEASRAQRDNMLERLRDVESIVGRGDQGAGTMAGRALRARQLMMNDDFSMASMVIERESALGRKLTEPELAEVQKLAEEYRVKAEANEKRVAELTKQVEEAEAARIAAQAAADAKQIRINPKVLDYAEKLVLKLESRAEIASARLREKLARASSGVDPTIVLDLAEIGVAKLGRNALDFAKWSKVILDEFGPKIQDYLKDGYEASKRLLDEELNRAEKIKGAPRIREVIISKPSNQPEMIVSKLSKTLQKNPAADIAFPARRLARSLWTPNIKPMELVDKVHGLLKQVLPDITKRDTMDALSGYGRYKMLKKDALSMGIRDINQQLQQLAKLDDMAKGKAPVRTGFERQSPSDEGRRLIKQVEEAKKKGGYNVTDPETQLRTAMQAAQRRLENQIKDLEHEIQTRHRIVKNKRKLEYDDKLKGLQARRDALKEIHDEVFKPEPLTDAQRLAIWKEKALDKIDDYRERIAAGDIHPKPRPDPVRFDSEAIKLRYALSLVHKAWLDLKLKDHLSKRSQGKKIFDGAANVIRFSRAMMTGGEFSGVLRQGGFLTASHPVITAKALSPMFKALWSEKNQFKINEEIHTRPNAPLYDKAKLDLTEMGNKLSTMEEHYMFTVSEKLAKIWGVKHTFAFVNAFQRAYTTFLNRLRADAFDALVDTYGDSPEMTNRIANLINVATGRGSTGLGRYVGPGANAVFFAPRYSISRFQLLLGQPAWGGSMATRRMVINQYARALGGAAVIYALGSAAGGSIEKDPRSPDFGKIRFGNTRIDPLAGLAQVTRLMATELSGWRKTAKGKIEPIRDQARIPTGKPSQKVKFGQQNGADVIWNFARTKLSPQVALPFNFMSGKYPVGKKFNMKDQLLNMVVPITYGDIADAMRANGFPQGAIFSVLALFGAGVQTYDEKKRNIP